MLNKSEERNETCHLFFLIFPRIIRRIYSEYTDTIEPFGMDENWRSFPYGGGDVDGFGQELANEIRLRVREETGLTVSIGVSFSKIFAKLGSDMKKPDAVTAISKDNYREKVWPLPVSEVLYVGRSTTRKLVNMNIHTHLHLIHNSVYTSAILPWSRSEVSYEYDSAFGTDQREGRPHT